MRDALRDQAATYILGALVAAGERDPNSAAARAYLAAEALMNKHGNDFGMDGAWILGVAIPCMAGLAAESPSANLDACAGLALQMAAALRARTRSP